MTVSFYRKRWIADRYIVDEQPSAVYRAETVEIRDEKWITVDGDDLSIDNENYVCRIGG